MIGPLAKPASSTRARRPRFSPAFAGFALAAIARTAGMKLPAAAPMSAREPTRAARDPAKAKPMPPTTARLRPAMRSCLARPRSASGATTSWTTRPTTKPVAVMSPSSDVDRPVASWRSEMSANTTLVEAFRTNVATRIRPIAGGSVAVAPGRARAGSVTSIPSTLLTPPPPAGPDSPGDPQVTF